jgi:uncharacterized caspase-like protein
MPNFVPSIVSLFRWVGALAIGILSAPIVSMGADAPLKILSPAQGGEVGAQTVDVEYSYDPTVFGESPKVAFKIDGLDAAPTRGMRVKGSVPEPASAASSSSSISEKKSVQIPPRDCEVQVVITSQDGKTHTASVRVKWSGKIVSPMNDGRLLILAVGVSQYDDDTITTLQLAAKDAKDFAEVAAMQEGGFYTKAEVRTLLNEEATRGAIIDALEWIENSVTADDTAMIFLAGHGIGEGGQFYFVPHDADDEKIRRSCLSFDDVQSTATSLPARTVVFLDACHSGGIGGGGSISTEISAVIAGWQKAKSNKGAVIFASSTGAQLSQEKLEWGNGAFTKALLEGLKGEAHHAKAGPISVSMLDNYIARKVKELTSDQQTPTTTRSMDMTDFDFALAGDARSEKARLEEDAFVKEAEKRAVEAVRDAFVSYQVIIMRKKKIKDLEDVNSGGEFDVEISEFRKEISAKEEIFSKSLMALNAITARNSIIVGAALAKREAELAEQLKTANKKSAETSIAAMSELKKQIKLPESY